MAAPSSQRGQQTTRRKTKCLVVRRGVALLTRVFLIRHAETARPNVFHGFESDTDLGPRGYRQAAVLGPVVAALKPDVLVCSNMLRARKTVQEIAHATGLPVQIEPLLHER